MHIVAFSINPLFPDRVMGGGPKQLQKVVLHLGELGHTVDIYCTRPAAGAEPFHWAEGVRVLPSLRFKQPFPQPYDTPHFNIANAIHEVGSALTHADRFYLHDGELLFPPIYEHVPTVVSLRDNVYPETMLGGFLFQGDALIAISDYSRRSYLATMGRFYPGFAERVRVVNNGLDFERFKPTPPAEILDIVPVDPAQHAIVVHPHRPEPSKGLVQTIDVATRLVHEYGIDTLRVVVPRWLEVGQSAEVMAYTGGLQQQIEAQGLGEHFVFHEWVPQALMPQYYSLGAVTLSLGHFVEAFGNTVYESLACGTPAIASRVATHRSLLPDHLLDKVHFGDAETAARLAADITRAGRRTPEATLAALHDTYSARDQVAAYAETILNAERLGGLDYVHTPLTEATRFVLAPWCYMWAGGIFHDFLAEHRRIPALEALLAAHPEGVTMPQMGDAWEGWYRDGYIVPAYE